MIVIFAITLGVSLVILGSIAGTVVFGGKKINKIRKGKARNLADESLKKADKDAKRDKKRAEKENKGKKVKVKKFKRNTAAIDTLLYNKKREEEALRLAEEKDNANKANPEDSKYIERRNVIEKKEWVKPTIELIKSEDELDKKSKDTKPVKLSNLSKKDKDISNFEEASDKLLEDIGGYILPDDEDKDDFTK